LFLPKDNFGFKLSISSLSFSVVDDADITNFTLQRFEGDRRFWKNEIRRLN